MEKKRIKIIIADDHSLFRKGIVELFKNNPVIQVIDDVADGEQLITSYKKHKPDIILVDIAMQGISGLQAFRKIKKFDPEVKALFLSMHTEEIYYHQIYCMGGKGLIDKNIKIEELEAAILTIMNNNIFFRNYNEESLMVLGSKFQAKDDISRFDDIEFSKREFEVLMHIKECETNEEIADKLHLSVRTIEKHRENIIKKAGTKNLMELLRFAQTYIIGN